MEKLDLFLDEEIMNCFKEIKLISFWNELDEIEKDKFNNLFLEATTNYLYEYEVKFNEKKRYYFKLKLENTKKIFLIKSIIDFICDIGLLAFKEKENLLAEKIYKEALIRSKNIYDKHYVYDKIIELYEVNKETKKKYRNKYINICKKDIEVFNKIREDYEEEFITITRRRYKAGFISKEKYIVEIENINEKLFPIPTSFKKLIDQYYQDENYELAIDICEKVLTFNVYENERIKIDNKKKNIERDLQSQKEFAAKKVTKIKINDNYIEEDKLCNDLLENQELELFLDSNLSIFLESLTNYNSLKCYELDVLQVKFNEIIEKYENEDLIGFDIGLIYIKLSEIYYYKKEDEKAIEILNDLIKIRRKKDVTKERIEEGDRLKHLMKTNSLKRDYFFSESNYKEHQELFDQAKEEYELKNYGRASYLAKRAKISADANNINVSIEDLLKLPKYLEKEKRYDESWEIYNKILEEKSSYITDNKEEISTIYKNMRLQLQIEKKHEEALKYGVLEYFSKAESYFNSDEEVKLEEFLSEKNIEDFLNPLLKKAKLEEEVEKFKEVFDVFNKKIANINYRTLEKELKNILKTS